MWLLDGAGDFTVAFWVRSGDTGYGLFSAAGPASDNTVLIFPSPNLTQVHILGVQTNVPAVLNDFAWHHFAVTRRGSGPVAAYLDGAPVASWTAGTGPLQVGAVVLGQDQDSVGGGFQPARAFQGRLDELVIYRRALSDAEVGALATPDGICDGTSAAGHGAF